MYIQKEKLIMLPGRGPLTRNLIFIIKLENFFWSPLVIHPDEVKACIKSSLYGLE